MTGNSKEFQLQDFPGVKTKWRGYDKYDFEFNGRKANIVAPAKPLSGKPWIWRPAFRGFSCCRYRNASIGLPCSAL